MHIGLQESACQWPQLQANLDPLHLSRINQVTAVSRAEIISTQSGTAAVCTKYELMYNPMFSVEQNGGIDLAGDRLHG